METFFLLLAVLPFSAAAFTDAGDIAALAAVKAAILPSSIPPRSCLSTWDFSSADPCATPRKAHFACGVGCRAAARGGAARVIAVILVDGGYAGPLSPAVGNLSFLSLLDLSGNNFHRPLPPSLGNLRRLRTLSLAFNSFSGPIPPPLARLRALKTLDLSYNRLSGELPPALPPSLAALSLRGNAISGPIRRAPFSQLQHLEVVEMAGNKLTGLVESWFLRLPSLQQVDLANNSLTGLSLGFPGERLVALDLGYNKIEGELPAGLGRFKKLASLNLRQNRLRGEIPAEYVGSSLRRLFLDGNFLKGRVPAGLLEVVGCLGDNCLEGCPDGAEICRPLQKPADVCGEAYAAVAGGVRR